MTPQALDRSALLPYLPRLLVQWLAEEPDSTWRELDGTVVFVDISGFTKLSEKLARSGKMGAEELAEAIGSCFARLLAIAYGNGGGLLKFGGDALLLLFTGTDHALKGARAAVGMRRALREIGRLETSGGKVQLRMSVGLHSGIFHMFLVGDSHREFMVTGPGATQTATMEGTADAGEILVSPSTAALLPPRTVGNAKGPGFLLRSDPGGLTTEPPAVEIPAPGELIERCVSRSTREHLLFGSGEPEHRRVVVGFLHFDGTDAMIERDGSAVFADALDELVRDVQAAVDDQGVCFLGTDVDKDGGKIILTAGAPSSTENDEEHMLIAARRIVEGERRIAVRIGVNRGHVFAGDIGPSYRRTYTVMGDAVNLAARVMAKAEPGQVLVTTEVLERSKVTFATVALEPFMVKGKAKPVQAFELGQIEGVGRELPSVVEQDRPPFVGREREMAVLREGLDGARRGEGRIVEVVGEPGIGKSRLLEELRAMASGFSTWATSCDVYQSSTPYFAFRRPLRQLVGIVGDEPEEAQVAVLRAFVVERMPELESRLPLLALPFGIELPDTVETARLTDERFRKEQVEDVTARFLSALLPPPALVTIEDVHWMDEASTELLQRLARGVGRGPWLVVVTRRDVTSGFVGRDLEFATELRPEPLDGAAAAAMLSDATEDAPLAPQEMEALAERSGGNPLFLKELIVAARAAGGLEELPDTIEDVITAQIDQLRPRDRTLLRYASVLGPSFPDRLAYSVLSSALADIGPQSWRYLSAFVTRDESGTVRFTHALVRDAAYGGLSFRRRRALHASVGETLELEADDPEDQAELLSMHFFNSDQPRKAWRYSLVAAERARSIYANYEAAEFYQRAIEAGRRIGVDQPELARIFESLGDVRDKGGVYDQATTAYAAARRLVGENRPALAELIRKEAVARERLGSHAQALRWYRRGMKLVQDDEDPVSQRLMARLSVGYASILGGRTRSREALRWATEAMRLAESCGARDVLAEAALTLDWIYHALGRPQEFPYPGVALRIFEESGDLTGVYRETTNLGVYAYLEGRWDDARVLWERGRQACEQMGDLVHAATGSNNIAEILSDQGLLGEAEAMFRDALRIWQAAGYREGIAYALGNLGRVAARAGRHDEAREQLERAKVLLLEIGEERAAVEIDARIAENLVLRGDATAASALIDETLRRLERLGGWATVMTMLNRLRAYALAQRGELEAARRAGHQALVIGREGSATYEIALTLEALARIDVLRGDQGLSEHTEESRRLFDQLGVVKTPEVPLPRAGQRHPSAIT
jgi:class 3 adenylate cyclase/tetratricopeptide (TPR) repeat protein